LIHQLKKININHLILSNNLKNNKIIVYLSILINIKVINYAIIDKFFVQQHDLFCFSLFKFHFLYDFNNNKIMFKSIVHYIKTKLQVFEKKLEETFFIIILC